VDLRQLRYFVAIVRSGSFIGASRELHISQPALGYQIKQLETELGVELLLRHSRGVLPTEPGQVLLSHAEDMLERMSRAERAMDAFRNRLSGEITLGVTPTCGRILAPELLERCASQPNLRISLRQGLSNQLFQATLAGQLDMTFCYDPHVDDPSRITPLYRERLFLIGPPDMLQEFNETVPFSQLGQFPLVLDDRFQVLRQLIESTARTQGISLQVTLEIEPVNLKREMIVHHRRCTILPYGLFRDEIESGQLAAVPIEAPVLERTLHIASRPGLLLSIERFMLSRIRPLVRQKIADGQVGWQEP
jgi:LysR family nitrogen assimilation transcriptional regulator